MKRLWFFFFLAFLGGPTWINSASAQPSPAPISDPSEPEDLEASLRKLRASFEEDYKANPNSEQAKSKYIMWLLRERRFDDAQVVIKELEALNPSGTQATVFRKYVPLFKATDKATKNDRRLHMEMAKDYGQALIADMEKQRGLEAGTVNKLFSDDKDPWKTALAVNAERKAKILKRFPSLCDTSQEVKLMSTNMAATSAFLDIQLKSGENGLLAAYPSFLTKHGEAPWSYIQYAQLFLRTKDYAHFNKTVENAVAKFPNDCSIILLKEAANDIESLQSDEQKESRGQQLNEELMNLSLAQAECASQMVTGGK